MKNSVVTSSPLCVQDEALITNLPIYHLDEKFWYDWLRTMSTIVSFSPDGVNGDLETIPQQEELQHGLRPVRKEPQNFLPVIGEAGAQQLSTQSLPYLLRVAAIKEKNVLWFLDVDCTRHNLHLY